MQQHQKMYSRFNEKGIQGIISNHKQKSIEFRFSRKTDCKIEQISTKNYEFHFLMVFITAGFY